MTPSVVLDAVCRIRSQRNINGVSTQQQQHHVCDSRVCDPQNEERAGVSNPRTQCVYVCQRGAVHVCTELECRLYHSEPNMVCPATGIQYLNGSTMSSYDKNDPRTWYAKAVVSSSSSGAAVAVAAPAAKKYTKRAFASEAEVTQHARRVVILLLFSNRRKNINRLAALEHVETSRKNVEDYITQQRSGQVPQLPYWSDVYRMTGIASTRDRLPLAEFLPNQSLTDYYTAVIVQVWEKHMRYLRAEDEEIRHRLSRNLEALCVGVLFKMQTGMTIRGCELLPQDDFLRAHLPSPTLLCEFDIDRKVCALGIDMVTDFYLYASAAGVSEIYLTLNAAALPTK